jgi:hypothetical protein
MKESERQSGHARTVAAVRTVRARHPRMQPRGRRCARTQPVRRPKRARLVHRDDVVKADAALDAARDAALDREKRRLGPRSLHKRIGARGRH